MSRSSVSSKGPLKLQFRVVLDVRAKPPSCWFSVSCHFVYVSKGLVMFLLLEIT